MKRSISRSLVSSCLLLAIAAQAGSRPRYGGTVRVSLQHKINSLDPVSEEDYPAERDRIASLIFETLTAVDSQGRAHPRLALWWSADPTKRRWQFRLRPANFQDGTAVTANDVVASLSRANSGWKYSVADRETITIEAPASVTHLPELLALEKYAIVKHNESALVGSGPYKLNEWQPGERALLGVNEDYWGGRAFPDVIEFQMGSSLRDQFLARQPDPYAAVELSIDQLRPLEQSNQRVALSQPSDLLVLLFLQPDAAPGLPARPGRKAVDPALRQALALSINRAAISNGLLQRKAKPASGLLPQWLTGYEFLFPGETDLERARQLRSTVAPQVATSPIALAYDFSDPVARLTAERIAVDAREAGITVQPYGESHVNSRSARASINADAVVLRIPLSSLEPSVALAQVAEEFGSYQESSSALAATRPEELCEAERKILSNSRMIPLAHVSQAVWLGVAAHNWVQYPSGAWNLDQLWLEGAR